MNCVTCGLPITALLSQGPENHRQCLQCYYTGKRIKAPSFSGEKQTPIEKTVTVSHVEGRNLFVVYGEGHRGLFVITG